MIFQKSWIFLKIKNIWGEVRILEDEIVQAPYDESAFDPDIPVFFLCNELPITVSAGLVQDKFPLDCRMDYNIQTYNTTFMGTQKLIRYGTQNSDEYAYLMLGKIGVFGNGLTTVLYFLVKSERIYIIRPL